MSAPPGLVDPARIAAVFGDDAHAVRVRRARKAGRCQAGRRSCVCRIEAGDQYVENPLAARDTALAGGFGLPRLCANCLGERCSVCVKQRAAEALAALPSAPASHVAALDALIRGTK